MDIVDAITIESRKYPGDDRPVFIGQAPSRHGDPTKPLTGRPGRRLAGFALMGPMEFYLSTVRANLLSRYAGGSGSGDAFPMVVAKANAMKITTLLDGRVVVFLGRQVAEAFGCRRPWFDWEEGSFLVGDRTARFRYAIMPHPSGRNRFWNDPQHIQEAREFMSELMKRESSVPRLRRVRERAGAIDGKRLGTRATKASLRGELSGSGADCMPKHF